MSEASAGLYLSLLVLEDPAEVAPEEDPAAPDGVSAGGRSTGGT
ncbi:hypothetical protein NPIL_372891, partial [Nephila pilipes]